MKKAQASTEFLVLFGTALFIFVLMLGFSMARNAEFQNAENIISLGSECSRISNIMSGVYAGGPGTQANVKTGNLVSLDNSSTISVETASGKHSASCVFYARSYYKTNLTGNLLIKNANWRVIVDNA